MLDSLQMIACCTEMLIINLIQNCYFLIWQTRIGKRYGHLSIDERFSKLVICLGRGGQMILRCPKDQHNHRTWNYIVKLWGHHLYSGTGNLPGKQVLVVFLQKPMYEIESCKKSQDLQITIWSLGDMASGWMSCRVSNQGSLRRHI